MPKAPSAWSLRKQGPGEVKAGDIQTVGDIEILNPDLVLCTLDEGADFRMELTIATGKGYVPADRNRPEDAPIGLIPVDSLFSPVKKVSYKVENTREGQILDYDKLTLTVETKAALSPDNAVAYAARILQDQLRSSSTSKSRASTSRRRPSPISPSTRCCSRRWTSWSCRCVRPTA